MTPLFSLVTTLTQATMGDSPVSLPSLLKFRASMVSTTLGANICPTVVLASISVGLANQFFRAIANLLEPASS